MHTFEIGSNRWKVIWKLKKYFGLPEIKVV
jgi:hypothetical protein